MMITLVWMVMMTMTVRTNTVGSVKRAAVVGLLLLGTGGGIALVRECFMRYKRVVCCCMLVLLQ